MNDKIAQELEQRADGRWYLSYDWYPAPLPDNLEAGDLAYLDTSYSFAGFQSGEQGGFKIGYASGNYLHSNFYTGELGKIEIGKFVILETTCIIANIYVSIKDHCMFSWGSVITDSWLDNTSYSSMSRKSILKDAAFSENRFPVLPYSNPVIIEENVWVGFDAVICPGVHIGTGAVIGCKTVVTENVPPYAVVAGNPGKIVKYLDPIDTNKIKEDAIRQYTRQ